MESETEEQERYEAERENTPALQASEIPLELHRCFGYSREHRVLRYAGLKRIHFRAHVYSFFTRPSSTDGFPAWSAPSPCHNEFQRNAHFISQLSCPVAFANLRPRISSLFANFVILWMRNTRCIRFHCFRFRWESRNRRFPSSFMSSCLTSNGEKIVSSQNVLLYE